MEHRWGERATVSIPVHLVCGQHVVRPAWIADASISGALVRTGLVLPLLARVELLLEHAARPVGGHVVRIAQHGIGIEWSELAPAAICVLLRPAMQHDRVAAPQRVARVS